MGQVGPTLEYVSVSVSSELLPECSEQRLGELRSISLSHQCTETLCTTRILCPRCFSINRTEYALKIIAVRTRLVQLVEWTPTSCSHDPIHSKSPSLSW